MRTYSKSAFDEARALWDSGHFSDEWKPYRHQAAMRGFIYPPEGTAFDSWDEDIPSQRAMLIRAIRETPRLLSAAIGRSQSWGEVVAFVIKRRDDMREELDERDRAIARSRADEQGPQEATDTIKAILNRIGDS